MDFNSRKTSSVSDESDIDEIKKEGVLTAVTDFNSTNYFIYKGEPMGYQFDMLQAFAQHLGVKLELITENNLDEAFKMLDNGEIDIFANNLTITTTRKEHFLFTLPHSTTKQVLVQKKSVDYSPIRTPLDLGDKIVYVQAGSASAQRLKNLSEEIGTKVIVVELAKYEADELIELVANGEIDFTVCDEDVARVNSYYFDNIDIDTPVSFDQNLAWALNKKSKGLQTSLNQWLEGFSKTAEYRIIKGKYFDNPFWARRVLSENVRIKMGNISIYDQGFRNASSSIDWDWRLFASLVYQESRFKHNVQSNMGAYGLMQFMPATSKYFGVQHQTDPETQIRAGARYLKWLEKRFDSIPDPDQRVKFILASYNAGIGHVIDARNLARKHGKDPNVWDNNVDFFILNKSNPDYYCDTTVRYGYFKGDETYNYVKQIMQRYKHYQNILPN
ncbi:MAG: transporter substrate-binding domain-containing protein [Bacteroidales bacterium]|jgi:membrane-bound lytic murein transglycosylase F|nr:transporter substrate-binding domain-containing protein [Bacteroidales bacterium]MDY0198209.1 transporter substrate-binding domain-containing protein [Tenuifilaceae bacterium]